MSAVEIHNLSAQPISGSQVDFEVDGTLQVAGNAEFGGDVGVEGDLLVGGGDPWYDVRAFGAVGDGTTDDTVAVNAAINAATSGGVVFFPPGTYKLTSAIVLPRVSQKGLILKGAGQAATQITFTGAGHAFTFGGTSNADSAYGQWIEDMTIQCTYAGNAIVGGALFRAATWCGLRRVRLNGSNLGNQVLVDFEGGSYYSFFNTIEGCDFRGIDQPSDIGLRLKATTADGANANWVKRNFFGTLKYGVHVASGDENFIAENHFGSFITTAVRLDNSGTGNANDNYVYCNQWDGPTNAVDVAAGAVETYVVFNLGTTAYINNGTNTIGFGNLNPAWTGAGTFKTLVLTGG